MSERKNALAGQPAPEVGYGKPPAHSQFGRATRQPEAGPRDRATARRRQGRRRSACRRSSSRRPTAPFRQRRQAPGDDPDGAGGDPTLAVNAAKGSQRAQRLFTQLLAATEREKRRGLRGFLASAVAFAWERELERRRVLGLTGPEPLPHPDHLVIDLEAGTAHIRGPATKEEKATTTSGKSAPRCSRRSCVSSRRSSRTGRRQERGAPGDRQDRAGPDHHPLRASGIPPGAAPSPGVVVPDDVGEE